MDRMQDHAVESLELRAESPILRAGNLGFTLKIQFHLLVLLSRIVRPNDRPIL
jgi:hypothetical protein